MFITDFSLNFLERDEIRAEQVYQQAELFKNDLTPLLPSIIVAEIGILVFYQTAALMKYHIQTDLQIKNNKLLMNFTVYSLISCRFSH